MATPSSDPDAMLAGFQQQIEAKMRQAQQLQDAATGVRVSESSRDGSVTVVVDHSGNMVDLQLTDAALRKRPDEVSSAVLSTLRSAQSQLTERVREAMEPVVGSDSETLDAVLGGFRERFPEPPPEQGEPRGRQADGYDDDGYDQSWMDNRRW